MRQLDLTPNPRVLRMLGNIPLKGWQCIAELMDNAIDSRDKESEDTLEIFIEIPGASRINQGEKITIRDTGVGMNSEELNKALKAGYSGQNTSDDNLGLFGMGFNISTAKLGNKTTVWTSTKEMDEEIGLEIDLLKMQREGAYKCEVKERKNTEISPIGKSGTIITVKDYTDEGKRLLRNRPAIINGIKNAYSKSLFKRYNIKCLVNNEELVGKNFLTWDHNQEGRHGTYAAQQFEPYVEIQELKLKSVPYCTYCLSENSFIAGDTLPNECSTCGQSGFIQTKDYKVSGWLGIQLFFHPKDYGVDIVRNGRIIEHNNKEIFYFEPRDKHGLDDDKINRLQTARTWENIPGTTTDALLEYPIDNKVLGGRIVGELYVDFVKPTYTKDSIENKNTEIWKDVLEIIRGTSPLQVDWATKRLHLEKNTSPLSRLYNAFRHTEPGNGNLVCGTKDSDTANPGNVRSLQYVDKHNAGDPDFQDDEKWYDLVLDAERRKDPDELPLPGPGPGPGPDPDPDPDPDPVPDNIGFKEVYDELEVGFSNQGITKKKVTIYKWIPPVLVFNPVKFIAPTGNEWHFLVNHHHNMVRDFPEGFEDLVIMEIASRFSQLIQDPEEWPITRVYYELKKKHYSERLLNADSLFTSANSFISELMDYLIEKEFTFEGIRKPELRNDQLETLRRNYLNQENREAGKTKFITENTSFLKYMDNNYVLEFIKEYPQFVFDQNFLKMPFASIEETILRREKLDEYFGYFHDVFWLINNISGLNKSALLSYKTRIIKAKLSLEELKNKMVG
jgi:hypothetical protein